MFDNIIIAGKNNIAINVVRYILKSNPSLNVYVIFNQNDDGIDNAWQKSFKKYCTGNELVTSITLEDSYEINNAIFLSLEFDQIIAPLLFRSKSLYNVHFSYLPYYKGMYTSALPLLHHELTSGVTLHCIDAGIDTGAIIAQEKIELNNIFNASQLYVNYIKKGTELIQLHFSSLLKNDFSVREQPKSQGSYFNQSTINYDALSLNFKSSAEAVVNQVRAYTFRQYQLIKFNADKISYAKILPTKSELEPGVVITENEYFYIVSTKSYDVFLAIDKLSELLSMVKNQNLSECEKLLKYNPTLAIEINELGQSGISLASKYNFVSIIQLFESVKSQFFE